MILRHRAPGNAHLHQPVNILRPSKFRPRHWPHRSAVLRLVLRIDLILPIFEDRIERAQPFASQKANLSDQTTDTSNRKSTPRESNKYNLIGILIVLVSVSILLLTTHPSQKSNITQKHIRLADIVVDPLTEISAHVERVPIARRADSALVVDDLLDAVVRARFQSSTYARYVCRCCEMPAGVPW